MIKRLMCDPQINMWRYLIEIANLVRTISIA